jgi:hypothetical protein
VIQQMLEVVLAAGEKVVYAKNVMALLDQPVAEMAAEKTGASGDEIALGRIIISHSVLSKIDAWPAAGAGTRMFSF